MRSLARDRVRRKDLPVGSHELLRFRTSVNPAMSLVIMILILIAHDSWSYESLQRPRLSDYLIDERRLCVGVAFSVRPVLVGQFAFQGSISQSVFRV